jgi:hypothetical protein
VVPVLVIALGIVPAVAVMPLLSARQGRRVLVVISHLHAWHADVVKSLTTH